MCEKVNGYNHSEARDKVVEDYIRSLKAEIMRLRDVNGNLFNTNSLRTNDINELKLEIYKKEQEIKRLKEIVNDQCKASTTKKE